MLDLDFQFSPETNPPVADFDTHQWSCQARNSLKIPFSSICITSRRCPNPQTLLKTPQHHHLPPKKKANPHLCDFSSLNSFLFAILKTNRANSVTDSFSSREVLFRYQLLSPPPDPPDLKKRSGDGVGTSTMGESGGPFDSVSWWLTHYQKKMQRFWHESLTSASIKLLDIRNYQ